MVGEREVNPNADWPEADLMLNQEVFIKNAEKVEIQA